MQARPDFRWIAIALWMLMVAGVARATETPATDATPEGPRVARTVICSQVQDHEPVDDLAIVPADTSRVYCWTDVRNASGEVLEHVWIHDGVTRARVRIHVGSDRWRCYSSKRLLPSWKGPWQVKISTADGQVLDSAEFTVQ
jgi:hypothetical protein